MSVVSFEVSSTSGTLHLDAAGAEGMTNPDLPCTVRTNLYPPSLGADNVWEVRAAWAPTTHVATVSIKDAATANVNGNGPLVLQLTPEFAGVALGRTATPGTAWNLVAAAAISDLSSLPVKLYRKRVPAGGGPEAPCYLSAGPQAPAPGTPTTGSFTVETVWMLRPFGNASPPAAYTGLRINEYAVQDMLVAIWNRCVGTDWGTSFAPSVIAWMFDYATDWPALPVHPNGVNPKWTTDLTDRLYNRVYLPFFVNNGSGWGTGDPPDAAPPVKSTGGRPPKR
jgi:hypothetical protein